MNPKAVDRLNRPLWRRSAHQAIASLSIAALVAGCTDPFYSAAEDPGNATSATPGASLSPTPTAASSSAVSPTASSPTASSPSATASPIANEFTFPQTSCGDRASELNVTWYPVFVDRANVDEIRRKFCGDAISTIRDKTGVPSVQVASFTSYDKASRFARLVGGEVESTAVASEQTTPTPSPASQSSPSPTVPASPDTASLIGQTAFLVAKDSSTPINVRQQASTTAGVQRIGYSGDRVQVFGSMQGSDGYTWYNIRFESGTEGWVRGDFVSKDQVAQAAPADRSPEPSPYYAPPAGASSTNSSANTTGSAALIAGDPNSSINIRERASTSSRVRYMGYAGDEVRISNQVQGDDGYTWYNVQFDSGASGWVRSDFVSK